jgi:hypothetical protein
MLHKLRAGLVRPERDTIGDQYPVEVDESFVETRLVDWSAGQTAPGALRRQPTSRPIGV